MLVGPDPLLLRRLAGGVVIRFHRMEEGGISPDAEADQNILASRTIAGGGDAEDAELLLQLQKKNKELADTEKGIENMLNAIQAGIINDSAKRRLDELEETKRKLELSIIQEKIKKPTFSYEQIMFYIMSFRNIDTNTLEGRRALIDRFVNSVVVYDDEILINLNYRKGAKRVSFKEIETACAGLDISSLLRPKTKIPRDSFRCCNKAEAAVMVFHCHMRFYVL